jgi:hypothetical protein
MKNTLIICTNHWSERERKHNQSILEIEGVASEVPFSLVASAHNLE